jgi:uncharacterized repeat protein (TIGR03803 family)
MHNGTCHTLHGMKFLAICLSAASVSAIKSVAAPTFETLHTFQLSSVGSAVPLAPQGKLLLAKDGNFYGTTSYGGSAGQGIVFKVTQDGVFSTLVNFSGSNGAYPLAGLVQARDGDLYGTTSQGGKFGKGTIFKLASNGELATMASFSGTNGSHPVGELVQGKDNSNFYGVTSEGGSAQSIGTVFKMSSTGIIATLVNFKSNIGLSPAAGLLLASDGNFYGTTTSGGSLGYGTIFKIPQNSVLTTFLDFNGTNGNAPHAPLIEASDGNFYGTTSSGGSHGFGTIFQITPTGQLLTCFEFPDHTRSSPDAGLVEGDDGMFYGTTTDPDNDDSAGTIFQMTSHGQLEVLVNFTQNTGYDNQFSRLIRGNDGNLYGMTTIKGSSTAGGQIFRLRLVPLPEPEITVKTPSGTPLISGWSNVSFGSIGTTASNSLTFSIGNTGSADLTGLSLKIDGEDASDFAITRSPLSPVSGPTGTTTFTIKFSPKTIGNRTAGLHITSNDPDKNPFNITLKGYGTIIAPEISVSLPTHKELVDGVSKENFGTVKLGKASQKRTFTIKNIGTAALSGLSVKKDGLDKAQFTLSGLSRTTLAPGASTTFTATFKPTAKGTRIAAIHIKSNDKDESPFDIKLSGLGAKR